VTTFLTVEEVVDLHDSEKVCPVIDRGKLESAVGQPSQTWGGEHLYPTLLHQAAALLFCLCAAHAFEDANKRCAWLSCATFLDINDVELLDVEQAEVEELMVNVAENEMDIPAIVEWLVARV
jgi:death-on-curing protein